ncbi:hypothetical protein CRUP_038261 [Coryphaenoides rupestris]|nr:hypothetical protein CRUP_038261 [Coryphaenoides rupestris]
MQHGDGSGRPDEPTTMDMTQDCVSMENTQEDMSSQNLMDFGVSSGPEVEPLRAPPGEEGTAEMQSPNGQTSTKRSNSPEPPPGEASRGSEPQHDLHLSCSPQDLPEDAAMLSPESPVCQRLPADTAAPDTEHRGPDRSGVLEPASAPTVTKVDSGSVTQDKAQAQTAATTTISKDAEKPARVGSSRTNHESGGRHAGTASRSFVFSPDDLDRAWLGTPIEELNRMPQCAPPLSHLKPSASHTVTVRTDLLREGDVPVQYPSKFKDAWDDMSVKMPCSEKNLFPMDTETDLLREGDVPVQYPSKFKDAWDDMSVKMPCSEKNLFPMDTEDGGRVQSRWELIHTALTAQFKSSLDVRKWDFTALNLLCTEVLEHCEAQQLFEVLLPGMVRLALSAPRLCTSVGSEAADTPLPHCRLH